MWFVLWLCFDGTQLNDPVDLCDEPARQESANGFQMVYIGGDGRRQVDHKAKANPLYKLI
jgi:hypothetical protein